MFSRICTIVVSAGLVAPVLVSADEPLSDKGGPAAGINNPQTGARTMASDEQFIKEAASGGMLEVQLAQWIQKTGQSESAKNFGKMIVEDHTKANAKLMAIAQQKKVDVSKDLNEKDKATLDRLSKLTGAEADRAYMSSMVDDHKHDIEAFENEAKDGKDSDVRSFAEMTLPTLKMHLQHAQDAVAKMSGPNADNAQPAAGKITPGEKDKNVPSPNQGEHPTPTPRLDGK